MSIQPGSSLLHYRIVDKIGEGGMGEVWLARDTTLDRDVAVKVLPETFALDADRLGRFEREAKLLASLNHPNIAGIFGLHADQGVRFLAMELVAGEDLSQRLQRGALPMEEGIAIGQKIADALEYAHERGIVHRDLKPANVKITPDGDVKVLDFGLAKAIEGDGFRSHDPSPSFATMTSPAMTQAGIILGTAAYMSPEQARGRPVDKRADNWAFGCVLYEMLTGDHLWSGDTVTDVIAAVVTREPDWSLLPSSTPASVRHLLRRCLDKDPRTRLRDIGEARITLTEADAGEPMSAAQPARTSTSSGWRVWSLAAAAALVVGVLLGRYLLAPEPPQVQAFEFDVTVPGSSIEVGSFALSPDGSRLALVIRDEAGNRQLAVRAMSQTDVRVLPGTTGAQYPFWSPDGREIAYFSGNQLFRIALDGAAARPVAPVSAPRGGAWAPGDIILIGSATGPILRVPASGGRPPEPLTKIEAGVEQAHAWPAMLPDGKRFVFLSDAATDDGHRIHLGSLDGGSTTILKQLIRSQPVVDSSGRLLLAERGQLLAYPFDLASGALGKESTLVATAVYPLGNQHEVPASASVRGMVAFQNTSAESHLVFVDRAGRVSRTVGRPERYGNVSISPDQRWLAYEIFTDTEEKLVWVEDLERGVRTPISHRGKDADSAVWSPDSRTVYFESNATGTWEIYRQAVTGGGDPERLGTPEGSLEALWDVSPDGRWMLAAASKGDDRSNLYVRSLDGTGGTGTEWMAWASGPADEAGGTFSPDSRWIAYTSDASGRSEVYVAPLEGGPSARRLQISAGGGNEPRFSPDGAMLYYRSPAFDWMAVDVHVTAEAVEAGPPRTLFAMPPMELPFFRNLMDVLPDGSGFVTVLPASNNISSIRIRTGR